MSVANPSDPFPELDPLKTLPEPLRSADPADTPAPTDLTAPHLPLAETAESVPVQPVTATPHVPGYEVTGEIARGGMGVVYSARDLPLHREVAVKTLLPSMVGHDEMAAQFAREARITARLPHPGVPPVHALGTLADGRPFLVMKLIRGRTLAAVLQARGARTSQSTADLDPTTPFAPGLLQVFEQICQAVGFAHSQGIVHRDLKPANIMVGSFGEVQVMDWGLAKAGVGRPESGVGDEANRLAATRRGASERWCSHAELKPPTSALTLAGQAKGTPAYMPPEQARGDWDAVDTRADVFALGGILCVVLTGSPPYTGTRILDVIRKAEAGDLADASARLDSCGADAELVRLAKWCLAPNPADRPPDACAVAALVEFYRLGQDDRVRVLEADRAVAATRVEAAARRAAAEAEAKRTALEMATEATRRAEVTRVLERWRRRLVAIAAAATGIILGTLVTSCWKGGPSSAGVIPAGEPACSATDAAPPKPPRRE